ncbi:glycosyltransferase [Phaeodactylibacter luteus]|uniref:Uncharacterized protein n=1 Tax=Phaeodactylibacter luteus TaxID=1564516 RepID=A0A5C6RQ62_9BACT|nr:glycosyltransferase [Phaeodactylibacter luteus]TXB63800.1 hypothetical protein FRY97_08265 [Phaeodactylibacter luteus]
MDNELPLVSVIIPCYNLGEYIDEAVDLMYKKHLENPHASLIYSTHFICDKTLKVIGKSTYVGTIPYKQSYLTLKNNTQHHISHFATFKKEAYQKTEGVNEKFKKSGG